jgi:hypothetical protein
MPAGFTVAPGSNFRLLSSCQQAGVSLGSPRKNVTKTRSIRPLFGKTMQFMAFDGKQTPDETISSQKIGQQKNKK